MNVLDMKIYETLKAAAHYSDPICGEWLYDCWVEHNKRYFSGKLHPATLMFILFPHGQTLASYDGLYRRSYLSQQLLTPRNEEDSEFPSFVSERLVSDMILHNCIHQFIWQEYEHVSELKKKRASHNNKYFVDEINRIAPILGFQANATVIIQKRVDGRVKWYAPPGSLARKDLEFWPASVRPPGYFDEEGQAILQPYISLSNNR